MSGARGAGAAALAAAALAAAPAAHAAAPSAALTKWNAIDGAVLTGDALIALEVETVRVRQGGTRARPGPVAVTYHAAIAVEAGLTARRTRFVRNRFSTAVAVRTSIGAMNGGRIAAGDGRFVVLPGGRGFAPPVVWCCGGGREVVVASDGRAGAPVPVAAGIDGERVRVLMRTADGATRLVSASPHALPGPDAPDPTVTDAAAPGAPARGTSAVGAGVAAWTDDPAGGVLWIGTPSDGGVAAPRAVRVGGRILGVWTDAGTVAVLLRQGRQVRVARIAPGATSPAIVWRGARVPRVGLGGGTLAVADGRVVFASRSGAVRRVSRTRGPVAAVAADGDRVAWFERIQRRGPDGLERRTVARLAQVAR